MSGTELLAALSRPQPPRRLRMFERLPTVFRDPERFRPGRVVDDGAGVTSAWVGRHRFAEGDTGEQVAALQLALARARHDPGPPDGSFGPRTQEAVRAFQRRHGLVVDGLVGPQTLGELTAPLLRRFLDGLDDVLDPVVGVLDNLPAYLSVATAPDGVLPWLAWLVGADTMEDWDHTRRRALVAQALEMHRARGTVRGVAAVVALHLGVAADDVVVRDGGETAWDLDPDVPLRAEPDRVVRVSLPVGVGELDDVLVALLRRLLEPTLPVGFSLMFELRAGGPG